MVNIAASVDTQEMEISSESARSSIVSLVDWDVGGKILGDGIYLSSGVSEVLVPVFPKLPELRLVVFCISDEKSQWNGMLLPIEVDVLEFQVDMPFSEELLVGKDWPWLHTTNVDPWLQFMST